jgi:hypothetical protein
MWEKINAEKVLEGKLEEQKPDGYLVRRRKDSTETDLNDKLGECGLNKNQ